MKSTVDLWRAVRSPGIGLPRRPPRAGGNVLDHEGQRKVRMRDPGTAGSLPEMQDSHRGGVQDEMCNRCIHYASNLLPRPVRCSGSSASVPPHTKGTQKRTPFRKESGAPITMRPQTALWGSGTAGQRLSWIDPSRQSYSKPTHPGGGKRSALRRARHRQGAAVGRLQGPVAKDEDREIFVARYRTGRSVPAEPGWSSAIPSAAGRTGPRESCNWPIRGGQTGGQ
jgi:hypothetical protein